MDVSNLSPDEREQFLNGPALAPPPGTVSNFDYPNRNDGRAHFTLATCLVLSTIFFIMRVYVRFLLLKLICIEDGVTTH